VLFIHEVHAVRGDCEDAFEAHLRDGWLPELAKTNDARLLWYLDHAHGTGRSYRVVTVTAVRDAAAWEALAGRLDSGDLAGWQRDLDNLRHDAEAKVLVPLPWSPLQAVELDEVPVDGAEHEMSVYMEDTVWPYAGRRAEYIARSGSHYAPSIDEARDAGRSILDVVASFRSAWGTHRHNEIVLWQKVLRHNLLLGLLTTRVPDAMRQPGSWMHDALDIRDQWESRLLRTAPWSPLF
jgi:hypothetical protein